MKSIFTKSLIAAGIMSAAMNASAMTVTATDATKLSAQGIEAGIPGTKQRIIFAINPEVDHPAGSKFVISFDQNAEFDLTSENISIEKGNGSFGLTATAVEGDENDGEVDSIEVTVDVGQPMLAGSQFIVSSIAAPVGGGPVAEGVIYSGNSTVSVKSFGPTGIQLEETATVAAATTVSQYTASVKTKFDQLIDRTDAAQFNDASVTDTATVTVTDIGGSLDAAVASTNAGDVKLLLKTDLTDLLAADFAGGAFVDTDGDGEDDSISFNLTIPSDGTPTDYSVDFEKTGVDANGNALAIPEVSFAATVVVEGSNDAAENTTPEFTFPSDLGLFELDASIINIPYLPLGYNLSPGIEISNDSGTDAAISVRGYDEYGNKFDLVPLLDLDGDQVFAKKHQVVKITERFLQKAFNLDVTKGHKVNVTLVVDADADAISVAPYYKDGNARVGIISDQYKK